MATGAKFVHIVDDVPELKERIAAMRAMAGRRLGHEAKKVRAAGAEVVVSDIDEAKPAPGGPAPEEAAPCAADRRRRQRSASLRMPPLRLEV